MQEDIVALVIGDEKEGLARLRNFEIAPPGSAHAALWDVSAFRVYLRRLAEHYFLSGVFPEGEALYTRRIVKLEFEHLRGQSNPRRASRYSNRHIGMTPILSIVFRGETYETSFGSSLLNGELFSVLPYTVWQKHMQPSILRAFI